MQLWRWIELEAACVSFKGCVVNVGLCFDWGVILICEVCRVGSEFGLESCCGGVGCDLESVRRTGICTCVCEADLLNECELKVESRLVSAEGTRKRAGSR